MDEAGECIIDYKTGLCEILRISGAYEKRMEEVNQKVDSLLFPIKETILEQAKESTDEAGIMVAFGCYISTSREKIGVVKERLDSYIKEMDKKVSFLRDSLSGQEDLVYFQ